MIRLISLSLLLLATAAVAHTRLLAPVPRSNNDALKDPNGPCGNVPRTALNTQYVMGQTVKLDWEETVNHSGCFLISLSTANDLNFVLRKNVPHSAVGAVPRAYTTNLTLPTGLVCDNCTLQLQQIMISNYDGGVCPPATLPVGSHYFSCADIQIVADAGVADAGDTGGGAGGGGGTGGGTGGGAGGAGGGTGGGTGGGAGGGTGGGATGGGAGGGSGGATGGSSGGVVGGDEPGAGCSAMPMGSLVVSMLLALGLRRRKP